jgi:hypothetical protein
LRRLAHTEIEITAPLIQELLRDQPPRPGRSPCATQSADALLLKEHAWLPSLAPHLAPPASAAASQIKPLDLLTKEPLGDAEHGDEGR